jgi:hypothetical protein
MIFKYIILLFIIIILFILISHYIDYTRINNDIHIQQSEHPSNDVISIMLSKKQPSIFRYELELWDGYDLLIGQQYDDIIHVLKNNKVLEHNVQQIYLKPYELPLTRKWNIKCHKITKNWNDIDTMPHYEDSYLHLIACFSGIATICLISPKHKQDINTITHNPKSTNHKNFKKELETNSDKYEHITIPLRPCNMIYIPYGWYYYIYSGKIDEYIAIFDAKCITYFN